MTVFLIGGTGFIGRHVAQRLVSAGHDVTVFHRGQTTPDLPDAVTFVHGARNESEDLEAAIDAAAPEVVLDVIPYTEAQAQTLVDVCSGRTDRLVVLSSGDVYRQYDGLRGQSNEPPDPVPLTEDAPLRSSRYPYRGSEADFAYIHDYDKILVEEQVRAGEVPATILRLPKVYGPGDSQHHVGGYLVRLHEADAEIILGEQQAQWRWSRGYVENVAAAIVQAITNEHAAGHTYNVGEPDALPEATWMQRVAATAGMPMSLRTVADSRVEEAPPFDWAYDLATDTRRLRTELDVAEPLSHEEALARTVAWERETGSLARGT